MVKKYSAVLTIAGERKLAAAAISGEPVGFTHMAVGDGGGTLPVPEPEKTGLVNELYRAPLNRLVVADNAANVIRAEMIMPPQTGGFWLREVALFDDEGECLVIANMPESYKPLLSEGSGRFQVISVWVAVSSTADVQLIINPSLVVATIDDVNRAKEEAKEYTDQVAGEIDQNIINAVENAIETAVRNAWELDNPVGTSRLFNQSLNPNDRWPWSTWEYAGEHLSIRTAKADGSDVGALGGSDTVTLAIENLPKHKFSVSGSTSEDPGAEMETALAGGHYHDIGVRGKNALHGSVGASPDYGYKGSDNSNEGDVPITSDAPEHVHSITIPPHKHTVTGETNEIGADKEFSIVERHKLQMLWHRVA